MNIVGMGLSPYTKELELLVAGERFDEFNEYTINFAASKLRKRKTVTVIPDDGKEIQVKTDLLSEHRNYWVSEFKFEVDGDLSGKAEILISWSDDEIIVELHKLDK